MPYPPRMFEAMAWARCQLAEGAKVGLTPNTGSK